MCYTGQCPNEDHMGDCRGGKCPPGFWGDDEDETVEDNEVDE